MQMIIRISYIRMKKVIRKSKRKERKKGRKISKTHDVK